MAQADVGGMPDNERRRPRTTQSNFDEIPDYVKQLDEDELFRRAELARNPPVPLSDEVVGNLKGLIPQLDQLDRELAVDKSYDPNNPAVYSWAYLQLRRAELKPIARRLLGGILGYAILRKVLPMLKEAVSTLSIGGLAAIALKVDFWASASIGFSAPLFLLLCLRGRDAGEDAMRRVLVMYLSCASLLLLSSIAVSTGAVRAATIPATVVRLAVIPCALWFWNDLRHDIASSRAFLAPLFKAWRILTAIFVCILGGLLRASILATHSPSAAFTLLGRASSSLRESVGNHFPIALSLLLDPGGVQFLAFVAYTSCLLYGLYALFASTNFLSIRDHRSANLPLANLLASTGVYAGGYSTESTRRFTSTAPSGVKSYRPSSVMLLEKVEGLLASDSPLLGKEDRPAFLDLLDYEQVVMKQKDIKQWMPARNQFLVEDDKLSERDIKMNALLTWARPLTERQTQMPFAQFFETLDENDYEYDPEADQWSFTTAAPVPDTIDVANSPETNAPDGENGLPRDGDDPGTVFV